MFLHVCAVPSEVLDPHAANFMTIMQDAMFPLLCGLVVHRLGRGNDLVVESEAMIAKIISFLQKATGTDTGQSKMKIYPMSHGGVDTDIVLKRMIAKPNAKRDWFDSRVDSLPLCGAHSALVSVPCEVLVREGHVSLSLERFARENPSPS